MTSKVGLQPQVSKVLKGLARRKKVSQQGLVQALILMADHKRTDLGIIDIDWDKLREEFPSATDRNKKTWSIVMQSVGELMKEFTTADEIALHSRWTLPQVERAMKELSNA